MAKAIALAANRIAAVLPLRLLRLGIVGGSALVLIAAGQALPSLGL